MRTQVELAVRDVLDELVRATSIHGSFNSAHEGYAVLLEEVDELWHEVKHGTKPRMREEAIQVGAMALRFLADITPRLEEEIQ